jgi:hypothetical protein
VTSHRPDTPRDDTLRELLASPLDEPPTGPKGTLGLIAVIAVIVVIAAAVAVPLLLLVGGDDDTGALEAPTSSTTTSTLAPGIPGYPAARSLAPAISAGPGRIVMVGGVEGNSHVTVGTGIAETWTYWTTSNRWYMAEPGGNPEARFGQAIAFDDQSGALVLFGGATGPGTFCGLVRRCATQETADTWWFFPDTGVWNQAPGSGGPSPRFGAAAGYDAGSDRIVLFGGSRAQGFSAVLYDDTWAYDFETDTWTQMSPENAPPPRAYAAITYDPGIDRILLWGGSGVDTEIDGSLWAYDLETDTWTEMTPGEDAPSPMWDATLVYADVIGRSVLIGGEGPIERQIAEGVTATEIGLNDVVWVFEASTGRWSRREPLAGGVAGHAAAYDSETERIVVVAWGTTALYDPVADTWEDVSPEDESAQDG